MRARLAQAAWFRFLVVDLQFPLNCSFIALLSVVVSVCVTGRRTRAPAPFPMASFTLSSLPQGWGVFQAGNASSDQPLILLLGWWGCSDKHLRKYAEMYQAWGISSLRYAERPLDSFGSEAAVLPSWSGFFSKLFTTAAATGTGDSSSSSSSSSSVTKQQRGGESSSGNNKERRRQQVVRELLSILRSSEQCLRHGVVVHVFSNGGCFVYEEILRNEGLRSMVRGAIFDSCPGRLSIWRLYLVLRQMASGGGGGGGGGGAASVGGNRGTQWQRRLGFDLAALALPAFLAFSLTRTALAGGAVRLRLLSLAVVAGFMWWGQESRDWAYWHGLRSSPSRAPEMYLYSQSDELVGSDRIDALVEHRRQLGVPVHARRWGQSRHVGHYRDHPVEYRQLVATFLDQLQQRRRRGSTSYLSGNSSRGSSPAASLAAMEGGGMQGGEGGRGGQPTTADFAGLQPPPPPPSPVVVAAS